jgi:hypothetical protein
LGFLDGRNWTFDCNLTAFDDTVTRYERRIMSFCSTSSAIAYLTPSRP